MRRLKAILVLLSYLLVLCTAIVAILLATLDDEDYRRILVWTVEHYTDYKVSINGPFSLDLSIMPALTLADVRIEPGRKDALPVSAHLGRFRIRIDMKPLLSGVILIKELLAEDAVISFTAGDDVRSDEGAERKPGNKLDDIDIPIFESVTLRNVNVSYFDKGTDFAFDFNLRSFVIDDMQDEGPLYVKGDGALNNADFAIKGSLGSLADALDRTRPYPIDLSLNVSDFSFILSGTVDDPVEGEGLNIGVSVEEADLSNILKIAGVDIPELGRMNLAGTLIGSVEAPGISDFNVTISGGNELEFSAKGQVANLISGEGTDIVIFGLSSNRDIIRTLFPGDLHDLTGFNFEGRLFNDNENYTLEEMSLSASNEEGTTVKADGNIVFGGTIAAPEVKKADLRLDLTAQNTKPLKPFLFDWLPDTGPVTGKARLVAMDKRLALEDLNVTAGKVDTVWINAQGRLGSIPLDSKSSVSEIDISLSIESEETPLLFAGFDVSMPELDSVSAQARIHGSGDRLIFDDIAVRTTDPGGVKAWLSGNAAMEQRENKESLWRYDLDVNMTAENAVSFRRLLLATTIPDLGPVHAAAHITGTTESMSMKDFLIQVGHPGPVRFELSGNIGNVVFGKDQPLSDVDIVGSFYAEKTSSLSKYVGMPIPDLGPIEHKWRLVVRKGGYGADDVEYIIGRKEDYRLRATGSTEYVMRGTNPAMEGFDLAVEINDLDWEAILGLLGQEVPGLGKLSGSFSLSGNPDDLAVSNADLLSSSPEGLEITARGNIKNIRVKSDRPVDGIDVKLSVKAPDAAIIGLPLGREIPLTGRLEIDGRLKKNKDKASLDSEINIGKTQILLSFEKAPVNGRPRIVVKAFSSKVYLADIGIYPEVPPDSSVPVGKTMSEADSIFSEEPMPFEFLKNNELTFNLDVDEMIGRNFVIRDLDIDVSLVNGFLRISPAKLTYADGFVSVESTVDARGPEPEIMLKINGEDIDVAALLAHVHMPLVLGGHLNLAVDLQSTGSSYRKIASALTGELGMAIENGRIKQTADLMGADAIDFLTAARSLGKYQKLNCLAVVFSFKDGIGNSKVIYIDTPSVRSQGIGTVNLSEESIDIAIKPEPKKGRLGGSSPVQIKGPLGRPSIKKLPFKEAARLYGEIFVPYVFLPARALGYVWYLMKDDKDEISPCLNMESKPEAAGNIK